MGIGIAFADCFVGSFELSLTSLRTGIFHHPFCNLENCSRVGGYLASGECLEGLIYEDSRLYFCAVSQIDV